MRTFLLFTALIFLGLSMKANDCGSAATLTAGTATTLSFDSFTDYSPVGQRPCSSTTPNGDAWFEYIPGGASNTTNYDITFKVTLSYSGRINMAILYSESVDAGDPCEWDANTEGYTYYNSVCNKQMNGVGHTYFLRNRGMDATGHFFILIERVGGTGGSVTVEPRINGTCSAPSNDRCTSATVLTSGSGIDPNTSTSSIAAWSVSASATTKCATKQRMNDGCQAGGADPTEDHYGARALGQCFWAGNLGDNGSWPFTLNSCDEFLENTVWYTFQVPISSSLWNIHFGSNTTCLQQPNDMVAMLLRSVNCGDANDAIRMQCSKFTVAGSIPSSDLTWSNLSLNAGTTYYLVFDGTRGSQCDMNVLITRSSLNPVLPATISTFDGRNDGKVNHLYWETSEETSHDYFEVEVSTDLVNFKTLGEVIGMGNVAQGQINSYDFTDNQAPVGIAYYRLKMVDIDGRSVYSKTIEINREADGLELDAIYPVPMKEQVKIRLGTSIAGDVQIELMDLSGRQVRYMSYYVQPGSNEAILDVAGLPAGMYLFRIQQGFDTIVKKVNKQ